MAEYTPKTWEIKHAYVSHCERADWYERDIPEMAKEFDRWLRQHEAEMVARTLNAVSAYLYEADLIEAVSQGRVSLIFNELTDDEWLDWLDDAESLIKRGN
jgi:Mg/Co/Ni transporter MgtE